MKRLGMFGCAFLVLVHSVKDRLPTNSYAGAFIQKRTMGSALLDVDPHPVAFDVNSLDLLLYKWFTPMFCVFEQQVSTA